MKLDIFQVDAFTNRLFGGNPACVVPLTNWLSKEIMMEIAKENAVAETAFFVEKGDRFHLRWFTPEIEMDLCGHATLATAHVLKSHLNYTKEQVVFQTLSGDLTVSFSNELYSLDFPSRKPLPATLPAIIQQSLNIQPMLVLKSRDYVLVYATEADIKNIAIIRQVFDQLNLDPGGVVVTAKGEHCDFVSRFFTPQASILEDPATGSAYCSLIPYWSEQLGKNELHSLQLSERIGEFFCVDNGDRVLISGNAKTYSVGCFWT
jgi:PhzF family phenazine biosynthesis protein